MKKLQSSLCLALLGLVVFVVSGCSSDPASEQPWLHIDPTWPSIYEGYFGPTGVGSCTGGSTCHEKPDQTGSVASNFVCADQAGCYASLTGSSNLIRTTDVMNPSATPFLAKLRQVNGAGKMPSDSNFVFQPEDIDVLEAWISKGATEQ